MNKGDRQRRRNSAKRHARRQARHQEGPSYKTTVRALTRAANKNGESIRNVLSGLRMRAILNGGI